MFLKHVDCLRRFLALLEDFYKLIAIINEPLVLPTFFFFTTYPLLDVFCLLFNGHVDFF